MPLRGEGIVRLAAQIHLVTGLRYWVPNREGISFAQDVP